MLVCACTGGGEGEVPCAFMVGGEEGWRGLSSYGRYGPPTLPVADTLLTIFV